jgi:DMSO/TMAO reductase YedYZ molybdopterin-dependent catalytic subunit
VPPGRYVTGGFPVLSAGPTPHTSPAEWTFSIRRDGDTLKSWTWQEMQTLPTETIIADIHCVTRWSKLDTMWEGVLLDTLLGQVDHDAGYAKPGATALRTVAAYVEAVSGRLEIIADFGSQRLAFTEPGTEAT